MKSGLLKKNKSRKWFSCFTFPIRNKFYIKVYNLDHSRTVTGILAESKNIFYFFNPNSLYPPVPYSWFMLLSIIGFKIFLLMPRTWEKRIRSAFFRYRFEVSLFFFLFYYTHYQTRLYFSIILALVFTTLGNVA